MRTATVLGLGIVLTFGVAGQASAQNLGGYMTAGSGSIDYLVHREVIPQISGGVHVGLANDRVRLGAQADVFFSNGYVSGRGGPLAEFALTPIQSRLRPFVTGGYFFAEGGPMWMFGGGVDVWLSGSVGVRAALQDAVRSSRVTGFAPPRSTFHEPALQIGFVWR